MKLIYLPSIVLLFSVSTAAARDVDGNLRQDTRRSTLIEQHVIDVDTVLQVDEEPSRLLKVFKSIRLPWLTDHVDVAKLDEGDVLLDEGDVLLEKELDIIEGENVSNDQNHSSTLSSKKNNIKNNKNDKNNKNNNNTVILEGKDIIEVDNSVYILGQGPGIASNIHSFLSTGLPPLPAFMDKGHGELSNSPSLPASTDQEDSSFEEQLHLHAGGGAGLQVNEDSRFLKAFKNLCHPWLTNHAVKINNDNVLLLLNKQDIIEEPEESSNSVHSSSMPTVDHGHGHGKESSYSYLPASANHSFEQSSNIHSSSTPVDHGHQGKIRQLQSCRLAGQSCGFSTIRCCNGLSCQSYGFSSQCKPTTSKPTTKLTTKPTTKPAKPTTSRPLTPTTSKPTSKFTASPTTARPTSKPTLQPTKSPTTSKPTARPTTSKPTASPTYDPTLLVYKVRVQLDGKNVLHMREVEVLDTSGVNRALYKSATQSSNPNGKPASTAVNGNLNDFSQTSIEAGAWWEVNLGEGVAVSRVTIHNRNDCCSGSLSNSVVSLLNQQGTILKSFGIGNATNIPVIDISVASYQTICDSLVCNDNNAKTLDVCFPVAYGSFSAGCHYFDNIDAIEQTLLLRTNPLMTIYEEMPSISENQVVEILKWIKQEVLQIRTPFCWKKSFGRGAGEVLSVCPSGKEQIGALCYSSCPANYERFGFDCHEKCKPDWTNNGLFCRLDEYGRGAGYPWKWGDGLNPLTRDNGMIQRCEAVHGSGNCEKSGLMYYPKCKAGYSAFGCCICRPSFSSCTAMGYATNAKLDLSCGKDIKIGDPTPLLCPPGLEQDGAICYPSCNSGYVGVGPVCWQKCGGSQVDCGAGCADSVASCVLATVDMVLSPLIVAANILTLGVGSSVTGAIDAGVDTVMVGGKAIKYTSKVGKYMLKAVDAFQTIKSGGKGLTYLQRVKNARVGGYFKVIKMVTFPSELAFRAYASMKIAERHFAADFIEMTSADIAAEIDSNLRPADAHYVKERWAQVQLAEMAESQAWEISSMVLSVVGMVDISGVVDLVNAYTKPICNTDFLFPKPTNALSKSSVLPTPNPWSTLALSKPNMLLSSKDNMCKDVTIQASGYSNCTGVVSAYDLVRNDFELSGLVFFLDNEKDVEKLHTSVDLYSVTLMAIDGFNSESTCTANVRVTDTTDAIVICPTIEPINNTKGHCNAAVTFEGPTIVDNCLAASTTSLSQGYPSGSLFPVGNTHMGYQIASGSQHCSFEVIVNDVEPPSISCDGLAQTLPTDRGKCTRYYTYQRPAATDNCVNTTTVQTKGPLYDPFLFPAKTTTNEFTGFDVALNSATCSFNVTIEDTENPTITCPNEAIQHYNKTSPDDAGYATTTDNCDGVQLTYSDTTDNINIGNSPGVTIRKWLSTDWKSNTNTCTQKIIEVDNEALTDANNCLYNSNAFDAAFVDDLQGIHQYATPSHFAYHVFHIGQPGEMMAMSIQIPYPFVTHGTTPIVGYDWLDIRTDSGLEPCFQHAGNIFFESDAQIVSGDYKKGECGDSHQVLVQVVTPDTGFIHLSINLAMGLNTTMKQNGDWTTASFDTDAYELKCKFNFSSAANPSYSPTVGLF